MTKEVSCETCARQEICLMRFDSVWCGLGEKWEPQEDKTHSKDNAP